MPVRIEGFLFVQPSGTEGVRVFGAATNRRNRGFLDGNAGRGNGLSFEWRHCGRTGGDEDAVHVDGWRHEHHAMRRESIAKGRERGGSESVTERGGNTVEGILCDTIYRGQQISLFFVCLITTLSMR